MPELPEVEIVKQSLEKSVLFQTIQEIQVRNRNLRFKVDINIKKKFNGLKITKIFRVSKYLLIKFQNNSFLLVHFGMSGTLHQVKKNIEKKNKNLSFYNNRDLPIRHNHIIIKFKKFSIIYNDPRRFGFFIPFEDEVNLKSFLKKLGPEPLTKKFNFVYLKKKLENKTGNIKNTLLDQKIVSGLGNIYVNEILNICKIDPLKTAKLLKEKDLKKIVKFTNIIIKKAINNGGSTIKNFKNILGKEGNFQDTFRAYNNDGNKCKNLNCKGVIKKNFISNRSTYFCTYCQM